MTPALQSYPQFGWTDPYTEGLGALGTESAQIVQSAGSIAGSVIPATVAITHTAIFGLTAAMSATIIGAGVAAVTLALVAWFSRKGPKQKVQTTKIVNDLEPLLQQNVAGYLNGPRTRTSQAQALANFDAVWQTLVENCRQEQYGDPGKRCIEDRDAGSCQWKEAGVCWNWFTGYRDPIANDPDVKPDPTTIQEIGSSFDQLTGGFLPSGGTGALFLVGAAALLFFAFAGGD